MNVSRREKLGLAAVATAAAAGTLLVGRHLQESHPVEQPPQLAAEFEQHMSVQKRLIRIRNAITRMHDYGAGNAWVEQTVDNGTRQAVRKTVYMAGLAQKNKAGQVIYDQIILYVNEGEPFPNRLMIVQGSDEPKYRPGNEVWTNAMEIDGSGADSNSSYLAMGQGREGTNRRNIFNSQGNLLEEVIDKAEGMLSLPQTDSYDPRLIA